MRKILFKMLKVLAITTLSIIPIFVASQKSSATSVDIPVTIVSYPKIDIPVKILPNPQINIPVNIVSNSVATGSTNNATGTVAPLTYLTPLFWDADMANSTSTKSDRRVWAHACSIYDKDDTAPVPHDHMELIVGGPDADQRPKEGASIFFMQNATDHTKTGPINYGDTIKIVAPFGGKCGDHPDAKKTGLLQPFRYVWVHVFDGMYNQPYCDLVVTRPEHPQTQDNEAIFVLESATPGKTGPVLSSDIINIKNLQNGAYLWANQNSRWGKQYWEILATVNGEYEAQAVKPAGINKAAGLEKFRFLLATPEIALDDQAKKDLAAIISEISSFAGPQSAANTPVAQAPTPTVITPAIATSATPAQSNNTPVALTAEQSAQIQAKKIELLAQEPDDNDYPIGFVKISGSAKHIAWGLRDNKIEKIINNKGKKVKEFTFDDFGLALLEDQSLAQYVQGVSLNTPWVKVDFEDEKGTEIKVSRAAVGIDGTTYVVSADGTSIYAVDWQGDKSLQMPHPARGFEQAFTVDEHREKHSKRKGKHHNKNKQKNNGKEQKHNEASGRGRGGLKHSKKVDKKKHKHIKNNQSKQKASSDQVTDDKNESAVTPVDSVVKTATN